MNNCHSALMLRSKRHRRCRPHKHAFTRDAQHKCHYLANLPAAQPEAQRQFDPDTRARLSVCVCICVHIALFVPYDGRSVSMHKEEYTAQQSIKCGSITTEKVTVHTTIIIKQDNSGEFRTPKPGFTNREESDASLNHEPIIIPSCHLVVYDLEQIKNHFEWSIFSHKTMRFYVFQYSILLLFTKLTSVCVNIHRTRYHTQDA